MDIEIDILESENISHVYQQQILRKEWVEREYLWNRYRKSSIDDFITIITQKW